MKYEYEIGFEPMEGDGPYFTITIILDEEREDPLDPWFYDLKGLGAHLMSDYYITPSLSGEVEEDDDEEEEET